MTIALSTGLAISFTGGSVTEAKIQLKTYKNCTELNKVHKGGVAKYSKYKNKGGKIKYKPVISKDLYERNVSKDRDKDGIACER